MKVSLPLRLALSALLNSVLAYSLDRFVPQYITIFGGIAAFVIIGCLLTLMNFLLRPLLHIITLPFRLIATLATTVAVNIFFLWIVERITLAMDPSIISLAITDGATGWIVIGSLLGLINWLFKHVL